MHSTSVQTDRKPMAGSVRARAYFSLNVGSNVAYMLVSTLVLFWYVPFLIDHLGVAVYAMVPLANSLVMYMTIITEGFNIAVNRYLTIDINRDNAQAANATFNTAFFMSLLLMALSMPLIFLVLWWFPNLFQVPQGLEQETRFVFGCVLLTFFLAVIGSNFEVSTLALHRFDLRNLVRALTLAVRVGSVVLLFSLFGARLWQVGVGFALGTLVTLTGAALFWRKLTPQLRIRSRDFDRRRLRDLLSLSGWSVINRLGMLLFLGSDLIIINIFWGAKQTGEYGTLILFPELIRSFVDTVTSVLNPAIVGRYAVQDFDGLYRLALNSVKVLGLLLALPVGLICGLAQPFLLLWLGSPFQSLNMLLIVMVGHLSITLATLPLTYVLTSYNRVRMQGVMTLMLGFLNVLFAIGLGVFLQGGMLAIAAATATMFAIKNLFFLSSYSAYTMQQPWWTFYPVLLTGATAAILIGLCAYGSTLLWSVDSWFELFAVASIISVAYGIIAWLIGLSYAERRHLLSLFLTTPNLIKAE